MDAFRSTKKLVMLGMLSALASILMLIEIPYPPFPFLKFDISDLPTLLVAQTLGIVPAVVTSIITSLISLIARGPRTPYGIGLITAALSSSTLAITYVWSKRVIKTDRGWSKVGRYGFVITIYSLLMTIFNFLFITPIFVGGLWFTDVWQWFDMSALAEYLGIEMNFNVGYTAMIAIVYLPFNAIKGLLILSLYSIIQPRLLPQLRKVLHMEE